MRNPKLGENKLAIPSHYQKLFPRRAEIILIALHIAVYALVAVLFQPSTPASAAAIGLCLIWASVVDFDRFEIPDLVSVLLALAATAWLVRSGEALVLHLGVGIVAGAVFYLIGEQYFRLRGVDGLGIGDAKLMVGIGILTGPFGVIWVVLIASISGLLTIVLTRVGSREESGALSGQGIAFGPFLCLSAWGVWLYQGAGF